MLVFFSLILALTLLVGIIYALRHHYERTRQDVVEREQPLPPLANEAPPQTRTQATEVVPPVAEADWRQRCLTLRDQGDYDAALASCQQAWPQWQSFDYAARVIRAAIRNLPTDSHVTRQEHQQEHQREYRQWLHKLYTLAAQASFLHDKVADMPEPTRQLLAQRFDREQVEKLEMPWADIGYRELRLLTKSDRRQMVQLWDEPEAHQSARNFHRKQWLTSIS